MRVEAYLGVAGLTVADFGLRLYSGTTAISTAGITLTPLSTLTDYAIDNLPDSTPGYTLTAEYPTGVYHAWRWGAAETLPAALLLPVRESGHDLASLEVVVFRDDVVYAGALTLVELGAPGDYALSGWPAPANDERWVVRWVAGGITWYYGWEGTVTSGGGPGTRYLEILATQRPFPFNTDERERHLFSLNFEALAAAPVNGWEEDLVALMGAGLAVLGGDTFIGRLATIPAGSGPYVTVIDTGGTQPEWTHNDNEYERLSAQIVVRAASYSAARARALAIWRALDGRRNQTVAP